MEDEKLFIHTLNDIRSRLVTYTHYDAIRISGLLRQILLDGGNSLLTRVNKKYGLKIVFKVSAADRGNKPENIPLIGRWFGLGSIPVNQDNFLKIDVLSQGEFVYNVQDIIENIANITGGVHRGKAKEKREEFFNHLTVKVKDSSECGFFIVDVLQMALHGIIEVVLDALKPLEDAINGHTSAGGF